nr:phosphoribosylanthranilate isomerase [Aridibaculum aurantiacum]
MVSGMVDINQMHQLYEENVQFAGLHFFPQSPYYILNHTTGETIKKEKLKVFKIGIFANASYEEIMKQVDAFGLDMVQLSGDETPYFCERISNYVSVIKGFHFVENDHMEWVIKDYYADCDMFLFNSSSTIYGTKTKQFNWRKLSGRNIGKPFLLSGAISPADVANIQRFRHDKVAKDLFSIVINSGFETAPGVKDMEAIRSFVQQVNQPLD